MRKDCMQLEQIKNPTDALNQNNFGLDLHNWILLYKITKHFLNYN